MALPIPRKTALVRLPPVITFLPRNIALRDGTTFRCLVGPPVGYPADVRANQVLELHRGDGVATRVTYTEVRAMLAPGDDTEALDPAVHALLVEFVAAVNAAVPYDVNNLAHDVGVMRIAEVCRANSTVNIVSRLAHRTEWSADELLLLITEFPELDLKATLMRHGFWRAKRKLGLWVHGAAPRVIAQFGADRHWGELELADDDVGGQ